jgi:mevalonate kinase
MTNPLFYAKILLFGEYGIIEDSQGLTLPYSFYKGTLKFSENQSDFEKKSNESLSKYAQYLSELNLPEAFKINVEAFKKDIKKGLFFDSNIPQGYGVGSSGVYMEVAVGDNYAASGSREGNGASSPDGQ